MAGDRLGSYLCVPAPESVCIADTYVFAAARSRTDTQAHLFFLFFTHSPTCLHSALLAGSSAAPTYVNLASVYR